MTDSAPDADALALTERAHPASAELDRLDAQAAVDLFAREDATVARAVAAARAEIAAAVELVAARLAAGGRLVYVGAGTSGRLALLDAVECPPTFSTAPELVQAVLAGGEAAVARAVEGAEDDEHGAARELDRRELGDRDVVVGVAASGRTPFVRGALAHARARGAATVMLACVPFADAPDDADVSIRVVTGPELLAGSTRLKAGTATKMVLNTLSTLVMVRLGKVHGHRMVDVASRGNAKLRARALRLVVEIAGVPAERAAELLDAAAGEVKTACVMATRGLDAAAARARLAERGGHLRDAL